MHRVRPTDRARAGLGQPEVTDLAGLHQLGHGADGLLDRHLRIDPVLVVEVDVVDPEPAQRRLARLAYVRGVAADQGRLAEPVGEAELGGQHDLVAASGDGPSDQFLVVPGAVEVGGVQEGHPEVEGMVQGRDRLGVVRGAVAVAHAHAPQALRRDRQVAQVPGGYIGHVAASWCRNHLPRTLGVGVHSMSTNGPGRRAAGALYPGRIRQRLVARRNGAQALRMTGQQSSRRPWSRRLPGPHHPI